ncbi:flavoprotein [Shigella flexneri]
MRFLQVLRDAAGYRNASGDGQAARQPCPSKRIFLCAKCRRLADVTHDARDLPPASLPVLFQTLGDGDFCLFNQTLSGIVHSYTDGFLTRAADGAERASPVGGCIVKHRTLGHLRLMTQAAEIGAVIMPPVPAFYHRPQSLDDVINQTVNRVLDQFAITLPEDLFARWQGA